MNYVLLDHLEVMKATAAIAAAAATAAATDASATATTAVATPAAAAPAAAGPAAASERVKALDEVNLDLVEGIAGTFTQDLLQHLIKKDTIYKAYLKQKKENAKARQHFAA